MNARDNDGVETGVTADGWVVRLEGRALETPGGHPLRIPAETLADVVADEWRARKDPVVWPEMLATRLAFAALDAGAAETTARIQAIVRLAETDLLCYPAEAPRELAVRQQALWAPLRERVETLWGIHFAVGAGIAPISQPPAVAGAARTWAARLDPFTLVAMDAAARLFGSAILAAAMEEGMLDAEAAFAAATIDEAFQQQTWGVDAEAAARRETLLSEAILIGRFLDALRSA